MPDRERDSSNLRWIIKKLFIEIQLNFPNSLYAKIQFQYLYVEVKSFVSLDQIVSLHPEFRNSIQFSKTKLCMKLVSHNDKNPFLATERSRHNEFLG